MMRKTGIFLIAAALVAAGIFAVSLKPQREVQFASAQYGDLALAVELEGSAQRDVKVPVTTDRSGTVSACVQEGQKISRGDVLLEIDDGTKAEIAKAEKQLSSQRKAKQKAQSGSKTSKSASSAARAVEQAVAVRTSIIKKAQNESADYEAYNSAVESVISASALQVMAPIETSSKQTKADTSKYDKQIDWLNSTLFSLGEKLTGLKTVSDIEGVVLRVDVTEGGEVGQGEVALVVGSEKYAISAVADTDELERIKAGMEARVTQDGRTWKSSVSGITGNRVIIAAPESFAAKEGSVVDVRVLTDSAADIIKLPVECVAKDEQGEYVMVGDGGRLARRSIVTGIRDDYTVTVTEGLGVSEQCAYYPEQYDEGEKYKG